MVRLLQLVLDNHHPPGCLIAADEVERETADRMLRSLEDQVHAEQVGKHVSISQQPRREVKRLVLPHVARPHHREPAKKRIGRHR